MEGDPKQRIITGPIDKNGIEYRLTAIFFSRFMSYAVKNQHLKVANNTAEGLAILCLAVSSLRLWHGQGHLYCDLHW